MSASAKNVFSDAAALWAMGDLDDHAGGHCLVSHGAVDVGVPLTGTDKEASLARGGNGKAARFRGGWLSIEQDARFQIDPRHWSVAVRLRDPDGRWLYPILGSYGSDQEVSLVLRAVDGRTLPFEDRNLFGASVPTIFAWMFRPGGPRSVRGSTSLIEAVWGAAAPNPPRVEALRRQGPPFSPLQHDVFNAVMRVCFPVDAIGPREWHDIVLCFSGPKFQLWIDGVLVDEEFPIGQTRPRTRPFLIGAAHEKGRVRAGFSGWIDYVAVWDRALRPDEIVRLAGGAAQVRDRERLMLGDEPASMQYFRPRGHNRKAGDCIPFWDAPARTFRLFYLVLRRNMHSKWDGGHGGLEIFQATTTDLKTWRHPPVAIPITEQWEAWNGTGAVVWHDGLYHWFYPCPCYEKGLRYGGIQHAISRDGVHFVKQSPHPFLPGGDCEVYQDERDTFHLIKAGPIRRVSMCTVRDKTLVAWVRLADLDQRGGSVLTIEAPDGRQFDAIVFGERVPRRWMPGSDRFRRTPPPDVQEQWPEETVGPDQVVQIAAVYHGNRGTMYRNGEKIASWKIPRPIEFSSGSSILIGLRHHGAAGRPNSTFHGEVLDVRIYDRVLTLDALRGLQPHCPGGLNPVVWFDFGSTEIADRAGTFPRGLLKRDARIREGALALDEGDWFCGPGTLHTLVRLTSTDLEHWTPKPPPFIETDVPNVAMCPHLFRFGAWYYFIGGNHWWRAQHPFGPWTPHCPSVLDNLAVPKTGAFGEHRRIYAGFLRDGGWGGNLLLRELVQDEHGWLGTRFVPELIPACGSELALDFHPGAGQCEVRNGSVRLVGSAGRADVTVPDVHRDFRLRFEVAPEPGVREFGVILLSGAAPRDGCDLTFRPKEGRVGFGRMTDSGGGQSGGPAIRGVRGLDNPFTVDIIVHHDIIDAEIAGFRTVATRYWNPDGNALHFFTLDGTVSFRHIRAHRLVERRQRLKK